MLLFEQAPELAYTAARGLAGCVAAFLALIVLNVLRQMVTPRDPARPPNVTHYIPWVGCAISYGMDPLNFLEQERKKHGNVFTYRLLGRNVTACLGPLGTDFVLNGRLRHVNEELAYTNFTTPVFGTEVCYDVPNAILMEQKAMMKRAFGTENFRRYVGMIVDETTKYISEVLLKDGVKTAVSDPIVVGGGITICTAAATLQGREVRAGLDSSFADLYHDLDGGFTPLNFVFPHLPLPSYRRRDRAHIKMREFYLDIMKARRASPEAPDMDMITALQNQTYKSGKPLTDKQIAHIMIALLMAGQHTSAGTLSWVILRLAEDPERLQALYDEQVKCHGDGKGGFNPLEYDTLQTPLLSAFIKEVLRLHLPLHSLMRKVVASHTVPTSLASPSAEPDASAWFKRSNEGRSYTIPEGNFVLAAPGFTQVDKRIWGQQAEEFDTEKWLKAGNVVGSAPGEEDMGEEDYGFGKISKGGKSAYLPFGAGRHRCIGEQFANCQIGTITAKLVRELTWTLNAPVFPKNDYTTMIVTPAAPRSVTFRRRA